MLSKPKVNLFLYLLGALASAAALVETLWLEPYANALGALGAALLALGRWDLVLPRPSTTGPAVEAQMPRLLEAPLQQPSTVEVETEPSKPTRKTRRRGAVQQ